VTLHHTAQIAEMNEKILRLTEVVEEQKFQIEKQKKDTKIIRENILEMQKAISTTIAVLYQRIDGIAYECIALVRFVPTFSTEITRWINQFVFWIRSEKIEEVKAFQCSKSFSIDLV
jgi:hypothetical protein